MNNNDEKILYVSYGADLTKKFSLKTRQIMEGDWYKKAFSKTILNIGGNTNGR